MADVRKAGLSNFSTGPRAAYTPFGAFATSTVGEIRVRSDQCAAIEQLYNTSPSLQAARAILVGQLLSSGVNLTRSGETVKLRPAFEKHLALHWMPFARTVVDSLLKWGFVVVALEELETAPFANLKRQRTASAVGPPQTDGRSDLLRGDAASGVGNLVPVVPELGTYEVALTPTGKLGYGRRGRIFTLSPAKAYEEDPEAAVFFRTRPDHVGNVVSPVAAAFDHVSFVNVLRSLALDAEMIRAQPTLVTQSMPRMSQSGNGAVEAANLFFDSESRAIHQQSETEEAAKQTANLALSAALAAQLNKERTTNHPQQTSAPAAPPLPPEKPPRIFALPDRQALVPNAMSPQARTDLEALMRASNEAICCAMGVPASVVFEVRCVACRRRRQRTKLRCSPLFACAGQVLIQFDVAASGAFARAPFPPASAHAPPPCLRSS